MPVDQSDGFRHLHLTDSVKSNTETTDRDLFNSKKLKG